MAKPLYDTIGEGYAAARLADPDFERQLHACLGSGRRVLNIGAGTGNYEPLERHVVAVEPSSAMIASPDSKPKNARQETNDSGLRSATARGMPGSGTSAPRPPSTSGTGSWSRRTVELSRSVSG